jgi:catechol 2,3-dioxygenase-like lactoylglutathione lyase family enzyme
VIDHIILRVSDLEDSKAFYEKALQPLGYEVLMSFPESVGMGLGGKPDFWLRKGSPGDAAHVAFATDRDTVDAFHAAALAAGGSDNGGPGVREVYHPNYYAAFVLDPDGHNIEAVSHQPAEG